MPVFSDGQKMTSTEWARLIQSIPASYVVWKDGTTYRAECLLSGGTDYSGTDAATVIQAVIDALGGDGGKIFFKKGTYPLSAALIIGATNRLTMEGEDLFRTKLDGSALADYAIQINSSFSLKFSNLNIGGGVAVTGSSDYTFDCVDFRTSGTDKWLLKITDTHGVFITNCEFIDGDLGGLLVEAVETVTSYIIVENSFFSGCNNYLIYFKGGNSPNYVRDSMITKNYIELAVTNPGHGLVLHNVHKIRVIDNTIAGQSSADHDLVRVDGDTGMYSILVKLLGNDIWNSTTENRYGLYLGNGARYSLISSNHIAGQTKGLYINSSAYRNRFTNNIINGGVTNLAGAGQENVFFKNYGYVTENSGTATILDSQTSVTFAHGLAGTPTLVTLGATHAEVADAIWSADATNITITVPSAVSANRNISWSAEYKP